MSCQGIFPIHDPKSEASTVILGRAGNGTIWFRDEAGAVIAPCNTPNAGYLGAT
jgi:hypothetical protein